MNLPPDRAHIDTEQRLENSQLFHQADIGQAFDIMQSADAFAVQAVNACRPALLHLLQTIEADFIADGRVIYLGAGTSGRLGVLDASEAPPTFCVDHNRFIGIIAGGDRSLRFSSEGMEDDPTGAQAALAALSLNKRDTVIGIAAGGTTPYVRGAFSIAKKLGAGHTAMIACAQVENPPELDHMIYCPSGAEVLTGSTRLKAGTVCKLLLNRISTILMQRSGRIYQNLMVDVRATNDKLRDRAARIISALCPLERAQAFALLEQAQGQCKAAIVMHHRNCDLPAALELLQQHNQQLGPCIDS